MPVLRDILLWVVLGGCGLWTLGGSCARAVPPTKVDAVCAQGTPSATSPEVSSERTIKPASLTRRFPFFLNLCYEIAGYIDRQPEEQQVALFYRFPPALRMFIAWYLPVDVSTRVFLAGMEPYYQRYPAEAETLRRISAWHVESIIPEMRRQAYYSGLKPDRIRARYDLLSPHEKKMLDLTVGELFPQPLILLDPDRVALTPQAVEFLKQSQSSFTTAQVWVKGGNLPMLTPDSRHLTDGFFVLDAPIQRFAGCMCISDSHCPQRGDGVKKDTRCQDGACTPMGAQCSVGLGLMDCTGQCLPINQAE
jgi:hypothetical protein